MIPFTKHRARTFGCAALAVVALVACTVRGDAAVAQRGTSQPTDSIKPAAPRGEPAASFPVPTREVADIGAGDGYYVNRLSPMVGASGRVYGNDIVRDYLVLLQTRVAREKLGNVQVVLGDAHDPRLPSGDVDVAIMIHMYHEIEQPFGLLWNLATSMKAGGRLVILDLERKTYGHGTPPALLRCELRAVAYRELSFTRTGSEEYVAIFAAPTVGARPTPAGIRAQLVASPCRG